jgi:hypothetical protein
MLSFQELRRFCSSQLKRPPTFRNMLLAAVQHDREELLQIFTCAGFALDDFAAALVAERPPAADESALVLDVIRSEQSPNDLHLVYALCRRQSALGAELVAAGCNVEKLAYHVSRRLAGMSGKYVMIRTSGLEESLTTISDSRLN